MSLANKPSRAWAIPLLLFAAILAHGSLIGLTDDEAYYWVLAQKPAAGYAYHPPAVAIVIALSQRLLGWLAGEASAVVVRFPAAACAALIVALGMGWVRRAAGPASARPGAEARAGLALVSVAGIFGLSWMMVPDLPLFAGWTLALAATWEICRGQARTRHYVALALGTALAILSKYSAVLGAFSGALSILLWAPRERRLKGWAAIVLGGMLAAVPILWWNATHEWVSILYQLRERHGEPHVSLVRYARFWAIEWVIAGPALALFALGLAWRASRGRASGAERFLLAWAAPGAAVFFAQPLWADFKPHWALIVWWPIALGLALSWASGGSRRLARWHVGYGMALTSLVLVACHVPVGSWLMARLSAGGSVDPRLDVTNDLYGWPELRAFIEREGGREALSMPVVASRYQTASQASFALGKGASVTMLPRDLKARDEWPAIGVSDGEGPEWPRLTRPVLFVADNRYEDGPGYPGASCRKAWTLESRRAGYLAKRIFVWKCEP